MTRLRWWLVERLSRALQPTEREAALGDFAESEVALGTAIRDLIGLIARRQAAAWYDWRPWLAFTSITGASTFALIFYAFVFSRSLVRYLWLMDNYEHFGPLVLDASGITLDASGITLSKGISRMLRQSVLLLIWAWTAGFTFGSLSRRTIWSNSLLLAGVVTAIFSILSVSGPSVLGRLSPISPLVLLVVVVVMPSFVTGACHGVRRGALATVPALAVAIAVSATTVITIAFAGWWRDLPIAIPLLITLVLCWPDAYIGITADWTSQRVKPIRKELP